MSLANKTLFVTGASRGIGLAIATRAARDGANIAIAAKTVKPDPRLPGTIFTAAETIEKNGGKALPLPCDIRDEQSVEKAVAEIERCAQDKRFVQVLMLVMGDTPLGRRALWPIYEAAERLSLPVGIHAGSAYHNPPTAVGWGSYHIEDYVGQAQAFQTQLTSLIVEGVFAKYPRLKMVMLESGVSWISPYLWRLHKFWRGVRMETPWVDRAPLELVRSNIRFSLQPFDAPPNEATLIRLFDHMQSDELVLFSTDYPHWQFDGQDALPEGLSPDLVRKIMIDNPHATYPRLKELPPKEARP